jgi:hypothetical protein
MRILPICVPLNSVRSQRLGYLIRNLLEAGAQGNIFGESGENRLPILAV